MTTATTDRIRTGSIVGLSFLLLGVSACSDLPLEPEREPPAETELEIQEPDFALAASGLISDVRVASGRRYEVAEPLGYGRKVYVDRDYHYKNVPSLVAGLPYIRTGNTDQRSSTVGQPFLQFTLHKPAVVYVAYNGSRVPGWLGRQGFANTGQTLTVARGQVTRYTLFAKSFPAGVVRLGSNRENGGSADMYTVIVKPDGAGGSMAKAQGSGFSTVINGTRPRGFGRGSYTLRKAGPGGRVYYVATSGNDKNSGTSSAPFRTINRAAQVAKAGDVVTIRGGTYRESVRVKNAGTASYPIVFQAASRGTVVLTGGSHQFVPANWTGGVKQSGSVYVTLRGLVFRNYAPTNNVDARNKAAVGAIKGWRIEDCLFDRAGYSGLDIRGSGVVVTKSTFQYHHTVALAASGDEGNKLHGIRVSDVILRGNNTRSDPLSGTTSLKVVKFWYTNGADVDNIESYENNGPGWWFDTQNTNWTLRNSYLHRNVGSSGRGLFLEKNYATGRVENNVFADNEVGGVVIRNSQGVTVRGNLFDGNGKALWVVASGGGSKYPLKNVTIVGNRFKSWERPAAIHSAGKEITSASRMNIKADNNIYDPGPQKELSYWDNTGMVRSLDDMRRKLGWEANGRIATIDSPR